MTQPDSATGAAALIKCPAGHENDPSNKRCVFCDALLPEAPIQETPQQAAILDCIGKVLCSSAEMTPPYGSVHHDLVELTINIHPDNNALASECYNRMSSNQPFAESRAACSILSELLVRAVRDGKESDLISSAEGLVNLLVAEMVRLMSTRAKTSQTELIPFLLCLKLLLKIDCTNKHFALSHLEQLIGAFGHQLEHLLSVFSQPMTRLIDSSNTGRGLQRATSTGGSGTSVQGLGFKVDQTVLTGFVETLLNAFRDPSQLQSSQGFRDFRRLVLWRWKVVQGNIESILPAPMQLIWTMALDPTHLLADKARSCLMENLYSDPSHKIETIYTKLRESIQSGEAEGCKAEGVDATEGVNATATSQAELLSMLNEALSAVIQDNEHVNSHQFSGSGDSLSLQITSELWQVDDKNVEHWVAKPAVKIVTHSSATFGQLTSRVLIELNIPNKEQMRCQLSLDGGKTFESQKPGMVLQQLGLTKVNTARIRIFPLLQGRSNQVQSEVSEHFPSDSSYYEPIFELLSRAAQKDGDEHHVVVERAWRVLEVLPSAVFGELSLDNMDNKDSWSELLDCSDAASCKAWKSVYILQLVHARLNPSHLGDHQGLDHGPIEWRRKVTTYSASRWCEWTVRVDSS